MFHKNGTNKGLNLKVLRKDANAMIVVERTKKRILRTIPERFIPTDSFLQDKGKLNLHILGLNKRGKFWAIKRPIAEIDKLPTDCAMATSYGPEIRAILGMKTPLTEKIKLGIFVGLIAMIIIVLFLIITAIGG